MKAGPLLFLAASAALWAGSPAAAQELVGGLYVHDVDTPLDLRGMEGGVDVQLGYRGGRIAGLHAIGSPSPYVFAAVNSSDDVHYAAAGLSWKIGGGAFFLRPGIGLAVHTGSLRVDPADPRRSLGSRVLFEPELGVGFRASDRVTIEASWVHMSNATILSHQNPGIDNLGVRLSYKLR